MNPLKLFKKSKYPVLKVTPETTAQQVFSAVVKHLQDQGHVCTKPGTGGSFRCANRNGESACAAACLMTNWESRKHAFAFMYAHGGAPRRLLPFADMIVALQHAHDNAWKDQTNVKINKELSRVADFFGVKFKTPITSWK